MSNNNLNFFSYVDMYCVKQDQFEQYHEQVIEADHVILSTINFEFNVQHPYAPLS